MIVKRLILTIGLTATLLLGPAAINPCSVASANSCCKVCRAGKACGDSCIARDKPCRKGAGCACNG